MTETELAQIAARCDAATAGPWKTDGFGLDGNGQTLLSASHILSPDCQVGFRHQANSTFVAHSRSDIPRLLNALATARARVRRGGHGRGRCVIGD